MQPLLSLIAKKEFYKLWVPIASINTMIEGNEVIAVYPRFPLASYISLVPISVSLKELCVSSNALSQEFVVDANWNWLVHLVRKTLYAR